MFNNSKMLSTKGTTENKYAIYN